MAEAARARRGQEPERAAGEPTGASEDLRPSGGVPAGGEDGPAGEPTEPSQDPGDPETLRRAAEEQVRQNARALRTFPLPMAAEPAFVFRPSKP